MKVINRLIPSYQVYVCILFLFFCTEFEVSGNKPTNNKEQKNNLEQWHFLWYQLNKCFNRCLHVLATFKRWDTDEKEPPSLNSISRKHSTNRGFVSKLHWAAVPSLHAEDGRYFSRGVESGRPKLGWSCNWKRMWRAPKRASAGTSAAKGRQGKMWACCRTGWLT